MFSTDIQLRVRYGETDKMGYAYYGQYATYFEVARVEALRSLGLRYRDMEEKGIMLPVLEYKTKYIKPAFYDDLLTIKISIPQLPAGRIWFHYEIYNEHKELLNKAETTLVFIDSSSHRPCRPPEDLMAALKEYF